MFGVSEMPVHDACGLIILKKVSALTEDERCRLFATIVERIHFNGASGELTVSFHDCGIRKLTELNVAET